MLFLRLPCCEGQAILLSCGAPRRRTLPDGAGVARTMQACRGMAWRGHSAHGTARSEAKRNGTTPHHITRHHITRHHPNRSQAKRHDTTDTTPPGRKRCQGNGMVLHEPKPGEMAWRCNASPIATANVSATAGKLPTHATLPPARIASATPVPCSVPSGACHRWPAVFDRRAHCNWTCEILTYIIRPPFPDSSVGRATDC